ncbi:PD40 domain-containing protein [bacterium]|nr:PD40 domain-containing protein [bacterium]
MRERTLFGGIASSVRIMIAAFAVFALFTVLQPDALFANGYDTYPPPICWSPTGDMLMAVMDDELWVVSTDGYADVLGYGEVASPTFSEDGKYIAFVEDGELRVFGLSTRQMIDIETGGDVLDCAFDRTVPDGESSYQLYFTAGPRFYGCDIFRYDFKLETIFIETDTGDASASAPVPSPDKSGFAFVLHGIESPGGYEQLWFKAGPHSEIAPLTAEQEFGEWGYHESNPVFLDPHTIVFQRGGWGDWNLYSLDLNTGRETLFLNDAQQASVSRYRGIMAFTRRSYFAKTHEEYDWEIMPSVWVKYLDTGEAYKVSASGVWAEFPAVSPDGTHIAWIETVERPRVVIRTVVDAVG